MRWLVIIVASLATTMLDVSAIDQAAAPTAGPTRQNVVLDNPRVRVYRYTTGVLTGMDHGPAVVVSLQNSPGTRAGSAVWVDDVAARSNGAPARGGVVIVQPRRQTPALAR